MIAIIMILINNEMNTNNNHVHNTVNDNSKINNAHNDRALMLINSIFIYCPI